MLARLSVLFLMAALATFPADTSESMRERYGKPIADDQAPAGTETFLVRPMLVASVLYGKSGHMCDTLIRQERPVYPLQSEKNAIDPVQVERIVNELVPEEVRGKPVGTYLLNVRCSKEGLVCSGVAYDYENVNIRHNESGENEQYALIRWKRDECHFEPYPSRSPLEGSSR